MTGEAQDGGTGQGSATEPVEAAAVVGEAAPAGDAPTEPAVAEAAPLSDLVRDAFAVYLDKSGARAEYGDHVNVDLAFLKAHGVPMVATLFRELATRLVPQDLKLDVPLVPRPLAPDTAAPPPEGAARPVSVNLDLGGIIGRMFAPKPPEPPKGP